MLKQNYELILKELINICSHITSFKQIRKSKLADLGLVLLNQTAEYMSYNPELHLLRTIKERILMPKLGALFTTSEGNAFFTIRVEQKYK